MVLSSIRQGLQVVDQNDRIVGLPFTSEEVLMTLPGGSLLHIGHLSQSGAREQRSGYRYKKFFHNKILLIKC